MPGTASKCKKVSTTCNHEPRPGDPHPICEGCKKSRFGVDSLCTFQRRCEHCAGMSDVEFQQLLDARQKNENKLRARQAAKESKNRALQRARSLPSSPAANKASPSLVDLSSGEPLPNLSAQSTKQPNVAEMLRQIQRKAVNDLGANLEIASYNMLQQAGQDAIQYCMQRSLHPSTLRWAISDATMLDKPLREVSKLCSSVDQAALKSVGSAQATGTAPRDIYNEAGTSTVISATTSTPPADKNVDMASPVTRSSLKLSSMSPKGASATVSQVTPKTLKSLKASACKEASATATATLTSLQESSQQPLFEQLPDVGDSALNSSTDTASSAGSFVPTDLRTQRLRDVRPMTPLSLDKSFDENPIDIEQAAQPLNLRAVYSYIGSVVPGVDAVPVQPASQIRHIRSALQPDTSDHVYVALTTPSSIRNCIVGRQTELHDQQKSGKAKELQRVTNSDILRVKGNMYTPGDDVWPLQAPPLPDGFNPWLPLLDKQSKVSISYNDVCNMESIARLGSHNSGQLESALVAIAPFLKRGKDNADCQQLYDLLGTLIRDNMKISTDLATKFFQLRRDLALANSTFEDKDRSELRFTPYTGSPFLFCPERLESMREAARKRATDAALQRSLQ